MARPCPSANQAKNQSCQGATGKTHRGKICGGAAYTPHHRGNTLAHVHAGIDGHTFREDASHSSIQISSPDNLQGTQLPQSRSAPDPAARWPLQTSPAHSWVPAPPVHLPCHITHTRCSTPYRSMMSTKCTFQQANNLSLLSLVSKLEPLPGTTIMRQ